MTNTTYQGWKNYETWNCALWLSNDAGFDYTIREFATNSNDSVSDLAEYIQAIVEEIMPDLGTSMFSDLLNYAMEQIDFYEIASNYLEYD